jgi:Fe2+ transport system protein FeoA
LAELGIIPNALLTVAEKAPFDGPLHVRVSGNARICALGKEVTDQVFVEIKD